jgi:hypothetical protein
MILPLTMMTTLDALPFLGPVHRTIVIVDIEGSTRRNNPAKGEMRRILYILLKRALLISGISQRHVEPTDRGDGALLLIRPDDEIPKTVVLGRLIPVLVTLLREHNASLDPSDWLRLRVVVHAGEVHFDGNGCYGNDVDVACRLLDAAAFKKALKEAVDSPLVLVVSEELFKGIIEQGYLDWGLNQPQIWVRVGIRRRQGRVIVPAAADHDLVGTDLAVTSDMDLAAMTDQFAGLLSAPVFPIMPVDNEDLILPEAGDDGPIALEAGDDDGPVQPGTGDEGLPQRARSASIRAGMTWWRSPMTA